MHSHLRRPAAAAAALIFVVLAIVAGAPSTALAAVTASPQASAPVAVGTSPQASAPVAVGTSPQASAPVAVGTSPQASAPVAVGTRRAKLDVGLALVPDLLPKVVPARFRIDGAQALSIAEHEPRMLAIHRAHHPLSYGVFVWVGDHFEIYFWWHGKIIADATVGRDGRPGAVYTGPLIWAVYGRGHFGQIFDSPWVWVTFGLAFLLPLGFLRRRSWLDVLDLGVLLTFGVSYAVFDHAHLEAAVWLVYPPLLYLLGRMLHRGVRPRSRPALDCRLPVWFLAAGLLALIGGRVFLTLQPSHVMDVGGASAIGAHKLLHGQSLYYASTGHGDTYGPIAYLAYAPFQLIWPGAQWMSYLGSVRATTIAFDLLTIAGLVAVGIRLRGRGRGLRLGLTLAWLWAACPWSVLVIEKSTNDGLVSLFAVLVLLMFSRPAKRGALLGLAAAAKFFPAILLGVVAVGPGSEPRRQWRTALAGFVIAGGLSIALFLPSGGLRELWQHTLGYQLIRPDVFSAWALHPALNPIKDAVGVAVALGAIALAFFPRGRRTLGQASALCAALVIGVQLPALHWFYLYIVWFLPFLLVAVLAGDSVGAAAGAPAADAHAAEPQPPQEPADAVLVGAS